MIENKVRDMLLLAMVQRNIFCPVTNEVLDIRTVKYLVDRDGDPNYVMSPEAYGVVTASAPITESLAKKGYHIPS